MIPRSCWRCAAAALDQVEPIDPELLGTRWLGGPSIAATAVTRLAGAMSAMTEPVALVLDHVELVSNQDCRDAIAELALHLPAGSQLAVAQRAAAADGCGPPERWWRSVSTTWPWMRPRPACCLKQWGFVSAMLTTAS